MASCAWLGRLPGPASSDPTGDGCCTSPTRSCKSAGRPASPACTAPNSTAFSPASWILRPFTWTRAVPGSATPGTSAQCVAAAPTVRSANFGVLAAIQLHHVGVVAAPWLFDVGVLAVVQLDEREAALGDQLAQVPYPADARERDSDGGGQDRAAKQREPADDVSQHHHD